MNANSIGNRRANLPTKSAVVRWLTLALIVGSALFARGPMALRPAVSDQTRCFWNQVQRWLSCHDRNGRINPLHKI